MPKQTIDLGEYKITIDYNKKSNKLEVKVLDKAGELIEGILIADDNEPKSNGIDLNLN